MKIREILLESPQDIGGYNPEELHDADMNTELYTQYKMNSRKTLLYSLSDTSNVYTTANSVFCLDDDFEHVSYEMEFKTKSHAVIGDFVWQASVWREGIGSPKTLPAQVFFDYLLPKYETIITDSKQSWDGRRFWIDRIRDAFSMGLNVYFFDFSNSNLVKMDSEQDWNAFHKKNQKLIWGAAPVFQMKRMVISNKEL